MNCFLSKKFVLFLFVYRRIVVISTKIWIFLHEKASRVVRKQKKGKQMWFSHSLCQILTQEGEKRFRVNWKVNLKGWKALGTVCVSDDNLILASTFQLWLPNIDYHFDIEKPTQKGKENTCRIHENQREECSAYMEIVISDGRTSPFLKVEPCVEFRLPLPPPLFPSESISGNHSADSTTRNPFFHVSFYLIKTSSAFCLQQTHQASTSLFSCFSIIWVADRKENTQAAVWT